MNKKIRTSYIIIAIIVIIVAIVYVFVWLGSRGVSNAPASSLHYTKIDAASMPVGAPLGAIDENGLPTYFPKALLVGESPTITMLNGLPLATASGTASGTIGNPSSQYAIQWISSSSMQSLYDKYQNYFLSGGWNVAGGNATSSAYRSINARSSGSSPVVVLVMMFSRANETLVTVDYMH